MEVKCNSKTIEDLPDEILSYILSYVPGSTLVHEVQYVCKKWRSLVKEDKLLWRDKWGLFFVKDVKEFDFPNIKLIRYVCSSSEQCLTFIAKLAEINCKIKKFKIHHIFPFKIDDILEEIARSSTFEHIEHLSFCGTSWTNHEIMARFPKLKVLIISDGYTVYGNPFRLLIDGCTALTTLHLRGCMYIDDSDLRYMVTKLKNTLVDLLVDACSLSSYSWLSDLVNLERLRVDLAMCWVLNSFLSVANLKKLKYLILNECKVEENEICRMIPFPFSSATIILDGVVCFKLSANIREENNLTIFINSRTPIITDVTQASMFDEIEDADIFFFTDRQ